MTTLDDDLNPDDIPTQEDTPQPDEDDQEGLIHEHEGRESLPNPEEEEAEETTEAEREEETEEPPPDTEEREPTEPAVDEDDGA